MSTKSSSLHTIVLIQFTIDVNTKKWYDYPTLQEGMLGIVNIYEEEIKKLNPHMKTCTYTIDELYEYLDGLGDISCLVLVPSTGTYAPHGIKYIKDEIYKILEKQTK